MSCSPFDLKDYFFGELSEPARTETEAHLGACVVCREELAGLDLTRAALLAVPDEEPPRRIAFVSDKVFEPRWWQRLWSSGPQLGFMAAAMLAAAIVVHGFVMRPAAAPPQETAAVTTPAPAMTDARIEKHIEAEVARAVAASEQRQIARTLEVVNAQLKQVRAEQRESLLVLHDYLDRAMKKNSLVRRAMYDQ